MDEYLNYSSCVTFVELTNDIFETVRDTAKLMYGQSSSIIQDEEIDGSKVFEDHRRLFDALEKLVSV